MGLGEHCQTVTSKERCLALCRPVELLRKESLAGLAPAAACRVLSHAYAAVVPITPLPYPPLPLNPTTPGGAGLQGFSHATCFEPMKQHGR